MDIVIVFHHKDIDTLPYCLDGINNNIQKKNIYIVSNKNPNMENTIYINETSYPFQKSDLEIYFNDTNKQRIGWYYQQLLKLYSFKVIPELTENFLIIDSDTVFLNPVDFIDINNILLYAYGEEHHLPYFDHINKIIPGLTRQFAEKSGICHHMVFTKKYIQELFTTIETYHNDKLWKIMMNFTDPSLLHLSGMSEYELYFNYMLKYHPEEMQLRELLWKNSRDLEQFNNGDRKQFLKVCSNFVHFVSIHNYIS